MAPEGTHIPSAHTYMQATHIHKIKISHFINVLKILKKMISLSGESVISQATIMQ